MTRSRHDGHAGHARSSCRICQDPAAEVREQRAALLDEQIANRDDDALHPAEVAIIEHDAECECDDGRDWDAGPCASCAAKGDCAPLRVPLLEVARVR